MQEQENQSRFQFGNVLKDKRNMYRLIMGIQNNYQGKLGKFGYTWIGTGITGEEIPRYWQGIPQMCSELNMIAKEYKKVGQARKIDISAGGRIIKITLDTDPDVVEENVKDNGGTEDTQSV